MAQHPTPDDAALPEDSPVDETPQDETPQDGTVAEAAEPMPATDEATVADANAAEDVEPDVPASDVVVPDEAPEPVEVVEPESPVAVVGASDVPQDDAREDVATDDPGTIGHLPDPAPTTPAPGTVAEVGARAPAGQAADTDHGTEEALAATGATEVVPAPPGTTSAPAEAAAPGGGDAVGQDAPVEPQPAPRPRPTAHGRHEAAASPPADAPGGWSKLGHAMRPQLTRSKLLAGLLCALLGFALAVQVSQTQEQQLSSLRQSDLVRLLDEVTQRANELEERVATLQSTRDELKSGSGQQQAALELAQKQSESQGILSGRLPAEGPGIELSIVEPGQPLSAPKMFNILEELRNAGAEVVEVNGVRLVTSSYFEDRDGGIVVDGQKITSPYRWTVIGDPSTLETALEIPGGAMATVRTAGAVPTITQEELVTVDATREPQAPRFATPVPAEDGS
ncbi:DUF881 domain-containing protein [Oerskovia enterophila]|uniref:DUF881 domain-containing protein n=1 Tax=Oerskovia enterophila TaxID=43678 RepID=UPI0037FC0718